MIKIHTTVILAVVMTTLLAACKQQQRAELDALYQVNKSIDAQIASAGAKQHDHLADFKEYVLRNFEKGAQERLLENTLAHLYMENYLKQQTLEKLKTKVLYQAEVREHLLALHFVERGTQTIPIKSLWPVLQQVAAFEDSLYRAYPKILTDLPFGKKMMTRLKTQKQQTEWALLWSDLNHWKLKLIKATQKIIEDQTRFAPAKQYQYSMGIELEVVTKSHAVLEGEEYQAEIFLSDMRNSKVNPRMKVNGHTIPAYNGKGLVRFHASKPGVYEWNGDITFKSKGRDTTFTIRKKYWVVPK